MNKPPLLVKILITTVICLIVGWATGLVTANAIGGWYADLQKPPFNPPNWLFAPVWSILYTMMGISAALIWHKGLNHPGVKGALVLFGAQLVLNGAWTLVFFGMHQMLLAFAVIITLWILIALCIRNFSKINKTAGLLLIPYLLWVSFASLLNISLWYLNH